MRYLNRIASLLICIVLLLSINLTASAHTADNKDKKGTITVEMEYDGKAVSGGTLAVYKIGDASEENGKYVFHKNDAMSGFDADINNIDDAALAENAAAFVQSNNLNAYEYAKNKNGKAVFTGVDLGLYLVVQTKASPGYEPLKPFLVSIPINDNGNYKFAVTAEGKMQKKQDSRPTSPDDHNKPSETNPSDNTSGEKLPQTGQLNWPVPILTALGLLVFALGWILCFNGKKKNNAK